MRWGVLGIAGVVLLLVAPPAQAEPPEPDDVVTLALRQVCDLQWVAEVCEASGYAEPQYRSEDDPSPGQPLALRVGVLHEHSGFSDGDPTAQPKDYWHAAKTGHNVVDGGVGDTGVIIDYLLSSEHSENEKLPITTAEVCIDPAAIPAQIAALNLFVGPLACGQNVLEAEQYDKWDTTLAQAIEATDIAPSGVYDGFTAMRGFEYTNDYYNHLGVYFSRNVVNAKIDGSLLSMAPFWQWLQEDSREGGGDDALVVFNHPGGFPALSPFDGDLPHNQILQATKGGSNWDDLTYLPAVDDRVMGIEVNGGDDLGWYVKALTKGWHLGPIAAEDEHQREWSTSEDGKTLVLTRGRGPRDYYFAFQHHRTVRVSKELIGGTPGTPATYPSTYFYADAGSIQDPAAVPLGSVLRGGDHSLRVAMSDLPPGEPVVLVSNTTSVPRPLGTAGADGSIEAVVPVSAPATGASWWFVVACPVGTEDCGTAEAYDVVTAPIWVEAEPAAPPAADGGYVAADSGTDGGTSAEHLPATGGSPAPVLLLAGIGFGVAVRRAARRRSSTL